MSLRARIAGAGLLVCLSLVASWEGVRTTAYRDIVGIWTICYGYTHGVEAGGRKTPAQCEDMLAQEVLKVYAGVRQCIDVRLTDGQRAAVVSLAYNVGTGAVCKSGFVRKLNARDPRACDELLRWVYAGGSREPVPGLVNRRVAERKVCLGGVA